MNTISTVSSGTPASCRSGANGVPVHSAVPTASRSHGWLSGPRLEHRPPVAGALERHGRRHGGSGPKVVEGKPHGLSEAGELEGPCGGIDERHVVVDQQVVHAGRRDVGEHRLERHAVVAGSLRELVEPDAVVASSLHGSDATQDRPGEATTAGRT